MNDMSTEFEERLPRSGDRLFIETARAQDASIVRDPAERFYRLPIGFKCAGDVLAERARVSVTERRNIIFPALFCYRQATEMYLKRLICRFGDGNSPNTHDLSLLWANYVQKILTKWSLCDATEVDAAERLIMEMHDADQRSDGFRYPTDRTQAPFPFGDRGIDLENLQEVMTGLANFFECAEMALEHADA